MRATCSRFKCRLVADERVGQWPDESSKAAVADGHHHVKVSLSVLEKLHFDVILLRLEFYLVPLHFVEF
jgi:hypothetical protein